jgi:hypothetical protein
MNPYTTEFKRRREIENAMAPLARAEWALSVVLTRLVQRARTQQEEDDIHELLAARRDVTTAKKRVAELQEEG